MSTPADIDPPESAEENRDFLQGVLEGIDDLDTTALPEQLSKTMKTSVGMGNWCGRCNSPSHHE